MRLYGVVAATLFALVAVLHVVRLFGQVPVRFGSSDVPLGVSWVGLIVAAGMSIWGYRAARR